MQVNRAPVHKPFSSPFVSFVGMPTFCCLILFYYLLLQFNAGDGYDEYKIGVCGC